MSIKKLDLSKLLRSSHHNSDNHQKLFGRAATLAEAYAICGMLIKGGESCAEDSDGHTREMIFLSAAHYSLSDEDIEKYWEASEDQRSVFLKGLNTTSSKIWMYDIPASVRHYFQHFVFGPVKRDPEFQKYLGLEQSQSAMDQ